MYGNNNNANTYYPTNYPKSSKEEYYTINNAPNTVVYHNEDTPINSAPVTVLDNKNVPTN